MRLTRGLHGERDAAHYLDHYLPDSRNYAVLHDLRLVLGDPDLIVHSLSQSQKNQIVAAFDCL